MRTNLGIDVSEHQPLIDWKRVKPYIDFAILRASHGVQSRDKSFENHYSAARGMQIPLGAYHYYYYGDPNRFAEETQNFLRQISGKHLPMGVYLDLEEQGLYVKDKPLSSLGRQQISELAAKALWDLRLAGFRVGIYANSYWFNTLIDVSRLPSDTLIWCADISGELDYSGHVDIHQYDFYGTLPGIPGKGLDLNRILSSQFNSIIPIVQALAVDGILGSQTIKKLQHVLKTTVDGFISKPRSEMVCALQRFLNQQASSSDAKLIIDGNWGKNTTTALQQFLFRNYPEHFEKASGRRPAAKDFDGILGNITIKVLQQWLNVQN